ncbi:MAG: caspase family protein [Rhodocyclaceae bacterium]|nr:caspase family protein [Rhodocyclaceae bacterium]
MTTRRLRFACFATLLALAGSACAQETDIYGLPKKPEIPDHVESAEPPKDLAEAGGEAVVSTVQAKSEWTSSGVRLRKGVKYRVSASGEWHMGGFCGRSGPSGVGSNSPLCFSFIPPFILPQHQVGTLIGKIGHDGRPFAVGEQIEFEADRDGTFYLRHNDPKGLISDNTGQVTAKVALAAPPPLVAPSVVAAPATGARQNGAAMPPATPPPPASASTQHWAVVIGVSSYADSRIPALRYAAKDAQALHDWLVSPSGGRYAPSRVKLLTDRNATAAAIKEALYTWLRQTIEEDVVVIYFAGHGSPDSPDTPQNLYLLPHDTRYDAIASTGFPMWDVETALKRFIKARRVVVLADACHSGGVGATFDVARRALGDTQPNRISSGLQNLASVGAGIAVISASDDRQLSAESAKFGGGHGVFTHYLLEGLKGKADYNGDSRVTLGELIPYLSEHVRRETLNAQSPTVAGRFDPALSLGR